MLCYLLSKIEKVLHTYFSRTASPPKFISMDELMSTSNIVNNMMLAHEIALDEDFRIEKPEPAEGR